MQTRSTPSDSLFRIEETDNVLLRNVGDERVWFQNWNDLTFEASLDFVPIAARLVLLFKVFFPDVFELAR